MKVINNFKVLGIVSILILSLGFIAGCSSKNKVSNTIQQSEETKGYENIDGKQTEKLLNSDKDVLIIDVRSEYEYEKGHLLNAINLPYDDDFKSELNEIIDYKDKTVLVYCRSGNRSEKAAVKLVDNGFKNVKNVTDGVDEYDYKLVKVDSITGREAEKIINDDKHDKDLIILDVREPKDFNNGHLLNAINIPIEDIDKREDVLWDLVPIYGVENSTGALFEGVQTLIDKLEQCISNTSSIMNYNDLGCKLKVTGYMPAEPRFILDDKGKQVINQARVKEDKALLDATVFYTPDQSGDIAWIEKSIDTSAVDTLKTTLLEYILMNTFIPNITDEAFTNADSNKALMKKFFGLETSLQETIKSMQKELLRMWENIIGRINEKKNKKFDFRDLSIELQTNIPTDKTEEVDMWLKLTDLLSDETIISKLPLELDTESELKKKKDEAEENMQEFYNNAEKNKKIGEEDNNIETNEDNNKEEE